MSISESEFKVGRFERAGAWLYLDEVMHRVLNDYTVMLSTVRLASMEVSDAVSTRTFSELTSRLQAGASAFQALSPRFDRSWRNLDEDLEALCASLTASMLVKDGVKLKLVTDPVRVSAAQSWKFCLVVSELITNAARHAFRFRQQGGSIEVELSGNSDTIRCVVKDDGSAPSLVVPGRGSAILDAIAAELGGTIIRNHGSDGSTVIIQVPAPSVLAAAGLRQVQS